jgi:hypothetical protein
MGSHEDFKQRSDLTRFVCKLLSHLCDMLCEDGRTSIASRSKTRVDTGSLCPGLQLITLDPAAFLLTCELELGVQGQ